MFHRQVVVAIGTAFLVGAMAQAEVVIETVTVGNPGNPGELSGEGAGGTGPDRICGAVDYVYQIGKYEETAVAGDPEVLWDGALSLGHWALRPASPGRSRERFALLIGAEGEVMAEHLSSVVDLFCGVARR